MDHGQLFSLVVKPPTVRVILSLAFTKGWKIRQFDFNNAFSNGELTETVFIAQTEGFSSSSSDVCHLHKTLYGLKQAPSAWFLKLSNVLH